MELTAVRCNHCGAPLQVGADTRFVTCKFCNTELAVKRTDNAAFTEAVAELAAKTDAMAGNLKVIELQNELERLDREWDLSREKFYVTTKAGGPQRPSPAAAIVSGVIGGIILLVWIGGALRLGAPSVFPLFGGLAMVALLVNVIRVVRRAGGLTQAEQDHQARRAELMVRIDAARAADRRT
jgi:hypothetical protein